MVDPGTGLPADNIRGNLRPNTRSGYTSPTNIGMYLWATLAARDLDIIGADEAVERIGLTLDHGRVPGAPRAVRAVLELVLAADRREADRLARAPEQPGHSVRVERRQRVAGLGADHGRQCRSRAAATRPGTLASSMNFGCYYDPNAKGPDAGAGLIRGGFWLTFRRAARWPATTAAWASRSSTPGTTTAPSTPSRGSPRYIGIALGQIPAAHYFGGWRTFPDTCDWSWPETKPIGEWREYLGVDVFEGAYPYDDKLVVPTWGGSMFEALMVPLVVPEEEWGPDSWARHPPAVRRVADRVRARRGRLRLLGLQPVEQPGRRLPRVRRRRHRHGHDRLHRPTSSG